MNRFLGYLLPLKIDGYVHAAAPLASGIKDADGMWVAKMHPLNAEAEDIERSEQLAAFFAGAPKLFDAANALLELYGPAAGYDGEARARWTALAKAIKACCDIKGARR